MTGMLRLTIAATTVFLVVLVGGFVYLVLQPEPKQTPPSNPLTTDMLVHGLTQACRVRASPAADGQIVCPVPEGGEIVIESTRCNLASKPITVDILATFERVNQVSEKVTLVAADDAEIQPGCTSSNTRWSLPAQVVPGVWRVNVEYTEAGQEVATATSNDFVVEASQ